jgi:hypothetical protein
MNPVRKRWVEDGKYLTTAGVSAGIDGGLHLAQRLVGADVAKLIQLGMQYEPEPPMGPIDWGTGRRLRAPDLAPRAARAARRSPLPRPSGRQPVTVQRSRG